MGVQNNMKRMTFGVEEEDFDGDMVLDVVLLDVEGLMIVR